MFGEPLFHWVTGVAGGVGTFGTDRLVGVCGEL